MNESLSRPPRATTAPAERIAAPRFTLSLHEIEEGPPPGSARAAIVLAALMMAGFIGWAAWFPVTERTMAEGEIVPQGQVQPVQHADGGVVDAVLVQSGQAVREGDVLVRLDAVGARAEHGAASARETTLDLAAARFAALAEGRIPDPAPTASLGALDAVRDSQALLAEAGLRLRATQLAVLDAELESRTASLAGSEAQLASAIGARNLGRVELDVMENLLRRGLARRAEVYQLQQSALRQGSEVNRIEAEIAVARIAVAETRARREELAARLRLDALTERARIEGELAEARQASARTQARLQRLEILAPVAGVLKEVVPRGPGSVVEPAGLVAEIVPQDRGVFAEVELPAERTAGVAPGVPARVKLLSFDATRHGSLSARVEHVSPSSFRRQDGTAYFRVRLVIEEGDATQAALRARATPGLSLVAEIHVGQQSLLAWLAKPVRNVMDRAFAEG